jgi:hypothetical protein
LIQKISRTLYRLPPNFQQPKITKFEKHEIQNHRYFLKAKKSDDHGLIIFSLFFFETTEK